MYTNAVFIQLLYVFKPIYLKCRWSITSIGNAELLRCPMEYYRIFMGCITVEVLSFFAFWWTECICLSICKSQGNLFLCHAILVQSFAGDGSSEIFCSLIFCRGRHCRQVRQGVVSPCHTCGTWRITWWGLNATENRHADRWGSCWTSHAAKSDGPIRYRDSCA